MQLGEELSFITSTRFAGRGYLQTPRTYNVIAGSYLVVNAYAGNVSPQLLQQAQTKLENTKSTLETADQAQIGALTRQELLGDMFHAGGLGYYAQLTALSHIMGLQAKGQHTLAAGTGTFGYEPNVDYFFGFPRAITTGGVAFDIPFLNIVASNDGDTNKKRQFNQQIGILSSALEHAVPEQMFVNEQNPGEAISAVKALQKASAQGQRIYQITQANQASTLPNIHHASETMDEIRNALNAGKEVTTHTDAISVPGWSGAGYIITDPATGDGAYKISGGGNGGWLIILGFVLLGVMMLLVTLPVLAATAVTFIPLITLILAEFFLIMQAIDFADFILDVGSSNCPDEVKKLLVGNAVFLLSIELIFVGYFNHLIKSADKIHEFFYEVMEIIGLDGYGYIMGELATELQKSRLKECN